jgi:hypothetical protein
MTTQPASRRVFPFKSCDLSLNKAIARGSVGWIDPDWDDLAGAELELRKPATRRTVARGSRNQYASED